MDKVIKNSIDNSIPWMCMDNGYLGKYKRVILNATAPITYRNGKRFEHGTQLLPWRGGKGSSILILPPSPPYMDTFNLRDFLNFIAHNVNIYTDKNIIVRVSKLDNKDVVINIVDEGQGFKEKDTNKIFKRFYSNRPDKFGEHSGLGLNIVKNLVELHNGTIKATNRVDQKGANMEITFPKV